MSANNIDSSREIAVRIQERFEFYVVAVSFTLLGLSIETAEFGVLSISDWFELTGWAFLFLASFIGLARLERVGPLYYLFAEIKDWKRLLTDPKIDKQQHSKIEEGIATRVGLKDSTNRLLGILSSMQRISFVAGVFFVMLARAMPALRTMVVQACG